MWALVAMVAPFFTSSWLYAEMPETVVHPTSPKSAAAHGGELQVGFTHALLPPGPPPPAPPPPPVGFGALEQTAFAVQHCGGPSEQGGALLARA